MALNRVHTWIAGEVLTASDLNTEFNNYITNVASLVTPVAFDLTFTDATYDIGKSGATRPRDLFLSRLLDISGTAAGQIKFPATQNPSSNANTLDDYSEGTWTPSDASGAGLSLTVVGTPRYTKNGRIVVATGAVTYPVTADATQAKIGGLPFTGATCTTAQMGGFVSYCDGGVVINQLLMPDAGTTVLCYRDAVGVTNGNMSAKSVRFTVVYHAAA